jgi:hypothetical protein
MLRTVAVAGALIGALATASSASAALAGAESATFDNRPNLQSVTYNGLVASFHFDKAVQPSTLFNRRAFTVGGYRASAGNIPASGADTANISISDPRTVLVTYTNTPIDFTAATFGAVSANAVQGFGTFATPNLADATGLTGSISESGTRGHTAGPDLAAVVLDPDNNEIDYVFDQGVLPYSVNPINPVNFDFADAAGVDHFGDTIVSVNKNVVTVAFTNDDIKSAQVAYVRGSTLSSGTAPFLLSADNNPTPAPPAASVDIPGKAGVTARTKLVSAELEPGGSTVVYTFDQNIGSVSGGGSNFYVVAANGGLINGNSATIIGKQVRVTFGGVDLFTEHLVRAAVVAGTASSTNPGNPLNLRGGVPIGGNAGAKASGWTTAPDAMSATMNPATGQVSVLFDSRIIPGSEKAAGFQLIGDNGTTIASATGTPTVQQAIGAPTQARVILQFQPTEVAIASAIRVTGGINTGGAGGVFSNVFGNAAVVGTAPVLGPGVAADSYPIQTLIVPTTTSTTFQASK